VTDQEIDHTLIRVRVSLIPYPLTENSMRGINASPPLLMIESYLFACFVAIAFIISNTQRTRDLDESHIPKVFKPWVNVPWKAQKELPFEYMEAPVINAIVSHKCLIMAVHGLTDR